MAKLRKHGKHSKQNTPEKSSQSVEIPLQLEILAKKRFGGSVNLRGIYFQLLFAIQTVLTNVIEQDHACKIWMEGVEDIDVYLRDESRLYQVKTSQNNINANLIWNTKVLQRFWEVSKEAPFITCWLVHNTTVTDKKINELGTPHISEETLNFWHQKFTHDHITITREQLEGFLERVTIRATNEQQLIKEIDDHLITVLNVNPGTEAAFSQALFQWVFNASKERKTITSGDLDEMLDFVKDSFARFPFNPAFQNHWISEVSFESSEEVAESGYYEGKAARPADVARKLPVRRHDWEKSIAEGIENFQITVIRSSSGQGKSTLAWLVAHTMLQKKFSIYEIHQCGSHNEAAAINDFIDGRLKAGRLPLIVIDGLSRYHSEWYHLAKLIGDKPARILITTRQEDWIRFGEGAESPSLKFIDFNLAFNEAKDIFAEIKARNKLHPSITTWEPPWEKISERGLMIEYIFLLTRGQMLEQRLKEQVHVLSGETANAAKLEILRLVSMAGFMNIRIKTTSLTDYIKEHIGFSIDRNEIYRQLEKEYYLRFEEDYVEGLHPVRSEHLVSILHSHIPVSESLFHLLEIIDEENTYDYFINGPLSFGKSWNEDLLARAAAVVAGRSFVEMIYAIDGLMHSEPFRFWYENKNIFDTVAAKGGLQLFVYDTVPFNNTNSLQSLADNLTAEQGSNIKFMMEQKKKLSTYTIKDSVLFRFCFLLRRELNNRNSFKKREGITFLFKWFRILNMAFPDIAPIREDELLGILETQDISEAAEVFHFYSLIHPLDYKEFITTNYDLVIGWVRKKTNTLTMYQEGNEFHIHYLLDKSADKAHEFSVYRIGIAYSFFPFYDYYCTKAIILPFPNEQTYKAVVQNSIKRISPDTLALGDDFSVHINKIWSKTILDQYAAGSAYEWQKQYIVFRKHCLEIFKKSVRLIEASLEDNERQRTRIIKEVVTRGTQFFTLDALLKKYPSSSKKYFEKERFSGELQAISTWRTSIRNFFNQIAGLMNPKEEKDRRLPLINIRAAHFHLTDMQEAFKRISEGSHSYFDTDQLCTEEAKWLKRLYHTVEFFVNRAHMTHTEKVVVASGAVDEWKVQEAQKRLQQVHTIVRRYQEESGYYFHLPKKIIEAEVLNYAVIGIKGIDPTKESELWDLSTGLSALSKTNIHFFTIIFADTDGNATGGFQFSRDYFAMFSKVVNEEDPVWDNSVTPIPIVPDEDLLQTIEGIRIKNIGAFGDDLFFRMMFNIWKLAEHRNRLNIKVDPERCWLEEAENEFRELILGDLNLLKEDPSNQPLPEDMVEQLLSKRSTPTIPQICDIMTQRAVSMKMIELN